MSVCCLSSGVDIKKPQCGWTELSRKLSFSACCRVQLCAHWVLQQNKLGVHASAPRNFRDKQKARIMHAGILVFSPLFSSYFSHHDWKHILTSQDYCSQGRIYKNASPLVRMESETAVQSLGTRKPTQQGTLQNPIKYPGCAPLSYFLLVKCYWKYLKATSNGHICVDRHNSELLWCHTI